MIITNTTNSLFEPQKYSHQGHSELIVPLLLLRLQRDRIEKKEDKSIFCLSASLTKTRYKKKVKTQFRFVDLSCWLTRTQMSLWHNILPHISFSKKLFSWHTRQLLDSMKHISIPREEKRLLRPWRQVKVSKCQCVCVCVIKSVCIIKKHGLERQNVYMGSFWPQFWMSLMNFIFC